MGGEAAGIQPGKATQNLFALPGCSGYNPCLLRMIVIFERISK